MAKSIVVLKSNNCDVIRTLYDEILMWDPEWHFFYEDQYMLVRCGDKYAERVMRILERIEVVYKDQGEWIDNIQITRDYQTAFSSVFHGYSELAMSINPEELEPVMDRIIHCFMNNVNSDEFRKIPLPKIEESWIWEPTWIVLNAICRAFTLGRIKERS